MALLKTSSSSTAQERPVLGPSSDRVGALGAYLYCLGGTEQTTSLPESSKSSGPRIGSWVTALRARRKNRIPYEQTNGEPLPPSSNRLRWRASDAQPISKEKPKRCHQPKTITGQAAERLHTVHPVVSNLWNSLLTDYRVLKRWCSRCNHP